MSILEQAVRVRVGLLRPGWGERDLAVSKVRMDFTFNSYIILDLSKHIEKPEVVYSNSIRTQQNHPPVINSSQSASAVSKVIGLALSKERDVT